MLKITSMDPTLIDSVDAGEDNTIDGVDNNKVNRAKVDAKIA